MPNGGGDKSSLNGEAKREHCRLVPKGLCPLEEVVRRLTVSKEQGLIGLGTFIGFFGGEVMGVHHIINLLVAAGLGGLHAWG